MLHLCGRLPRAPAGVVGSSALTLLWLLAPWPLTGQATVTSIVVDGAEVDGTARVEWFTFAAVAPAALKVGDVVNLDDELRSPRGGVEVELACADGGAAVVHESFRVLVVSPSEATEGAQCVLRVNVGAVDFSSTVPTGLESGDVVAGTRSTQYGMVVGRATDGHPTVTLVVFDGAVQVTRRGIDILVSRGTVMEVMRMGALDQVLSRSVQDADVLRSAGAFGRLAAGSVAPAERAVAARELASAYARVLREPTSAEAKIELGATGARYRTPSRLLQYQLQEVARVGPTNQQAATALALESAVLTVRGDSVAARAILQRALIQDSTVLTRVRGTLAVPARSLPPDVRTTPPPAGAANPAARIRAVVPDSGGVGGAP